MQNYVEIVKGLYVFWVRPQLQGELLVTKLELGNEKLQ